MGFVQIKYYWAVHPLRFSKYMNTSPTYVSAIVVVIGAIAQFSTINWSSPEAITPIVTAVVTLIAGIVIAVRRYQKGDINAIGSVK